MTPKQKPDTKPAHTGDPDQRYDPATELARALHADIDVILAAVPQALQDIEVGAFPGGGSTDPVTGGDTRDISDTIIDRRWDRAKQAEQWMHARTLALKAVVGAADTARRLYTPPKPGTTQGGVRIGAAQTCDYCRNTITDTPGDRAKRYGQEIFHREAGDGHGACYYTVLRQRGLIGRAS